MFSARSSTFSAAPGALRRAAADSQTKDHPVPCEIMKTYKEQLRDPRWQRRRMEILDRDKFRCRHCASEEKTLHVHHLFYETGRAPWEYPEHAYLTLCEDCHAEEERNKTVSDWRLIASLRALGADNKALDRLSLMLEELATCTKFPGSSLQRFEEALDKLWGHRVVNKDW